MKSVKRRLLSLLLAMVMVLSLAPSALAAPGGAGTPGTGTENPGTGTENPGTGTETPPHEHTPAAEWQHDDNYHWHLCSDPDCPKPTEQVEPKAHEFNWTVTKAATCEDKGSRTGTCVCGATRTEDIPATGHKYGADGKCEYCGQAQPVTLSLSDTTLAMSVNGGNRTLTATVVPANTALEWELVSGTSVAITPNGTTCTIVPVKAGVSVVRVSGGEKTASCTITVSDAKKNVTISGSSHNIANLLTTLQLSAKVTQGTDTTALPDDVTWTSNDPTIATVSTSGLVTPRKAGKATIRAALTADPTIYGTWDVIIDDSLSLTPSASSVTVPYGGWNMQFYVTASTNAASAGATGVKWTVPSYTTTTTPVLLNSTSVVSSSNVSITTPLSATNRTAGIALYGQKVGSANLRAVLVDNAGNEIGTPRTIPVTVGSSLSISPNPLRLTSYGAYGTLTAYFNNSPINANRVSWTCTPNSGTTPSTTGNSYIRLTSNSNGTATVTALANTPNAGTTVTATYRDSNDVVHTATTTVYVGISASNVATVTVYNTSSYNLNDPDDVGGSSIISQLESYFSSYYAGNAGRYYGLESVVFGERTNTYGSLNATVGTRYYVGGRSGYGTYPLENIVFTPTSSRTGTATFNITAYVYYDSYRYDPTPVSCTISFRVTEGTVAGGDVTYTASMGDNVYFRSGDFEDFWDDNFPRGTLTSVRFSVSGGTLRDSNGKTVGTAECYVSARSNQIDLDDVYFEPNSTNSKKAGTIRFNFTATGYARNSNQSVTRTGTVSIIYLSASPKDITYTVGTNGSVNLKASDFTAAYKEATGSTAPTGLTIVLQNVPSRGSLSYTDSSKSSASAVRLTSSNIKSRNFTTRSSGTNQINDVSYTGTSGTDTVEYIAYSGSTAQFSGKIVFNGAAPAPTDITVTFTSTSGAAAQFTQAAFTTANATVMAKTTRIRFTTPSNGNLLLSGTSSAAGVDIAPTSLGSVTYRPKAGYNGNDRCMFMCYDSTGTLVGSGTVTLVVVGNPTTTTPTTPSNGATSVSQFKDVPANAWYRTELADLVSKGIINGTSATTFAPNSAVNYGAALKMILRAAGYSAQEETGNNWAIHYKELAVSKGWISNDIALNDPIPRGAMADLTAKVLGISPSSAASPFADTANGYAVALYETKIFTGTPGENGGKPNFLGSNNLTRAQICAVIYRVNQYYETISSSQKPDGL